MSRKLRLALVIALTGILLARVQAEELTLYLMEVPPFALNEPTRKGIVGDVVLEAARRVGDTLSVVVVPSPRALAEVPDRNNALRIPLARLQDSEHRFVWISQVTNVERAFFSLDRKANSFAEARQLFNSIAVARDSAGYRILIEQGFPPSQLQIANQGDSAPRMLQTGRVDAWYNPILEAELLQSKLGGQRFVRGVALGATEQYLACSRRCDPALVRRYAKAIDAMRQDGTLARFAAPYLGVK